MGFFNIYATKTEIFDTIYVEVIFMKKFCLIIAFLLIFCACSENVAEEQNENPAETSSENSSQTEPEAGVKITEYDNFTVEKTTENWVTTIKIFDSDGNQLGVDYDSFEEISYSADFLEEKYYVGTVTEGTRLDYISYNSDPYFEKVEEVPNTESWILDEYGKPLTDIPFDYYEFSEKDTWGNEGFDAFYGFLNGDKYCYEIKDGKFILKYTEYAGETGNEYFGYKETVYYYGLGMNVGYGVNDSDGNVILEPFHSRIDFPCSDRLIIYYGYMAHNSYPYEHMAHITDINGNIFASYSDVYFFDFEEGSVWIAYYIGDDSHLEDRFDKDKGYLGDGYWFIDKDGNRISPCFKKIKIGEGSFSDMKSLDDTIIATDENGNTVEFSARKYAIDPKMSYLGIAEEAKIYRKAVKTGKTRPDIVYGKDGIFNSVTEVPEIKYWITDIDGNPLIEHPFYDYEFWEADENAFIDIYKLAGIKGCYQGNHYLYSFVNGTFKLIEFYEAGEYEMDEIIQSTTPSGYKRTQYTYGVGDEYSGLNDDKGNVIFEPIFTYIRIPFNDRFIVNTNNVDRMDGWEGFSVLMDSDKNILCTYTDIDFYVFDDGSYIGIARYVGGNENSGHILYDKDGNLLDLGYRFIDKDGNELSQCLGTEYLVYPLDEYVESYLDEFLTDFNGNTLDITGRDFIIAK